MRNGQGTETLARGTIYTGEWKDNQRDGQGTDGHNHAPRHQTVKAIHEIGEVNQGCGGNQQEDEDRQEEPTAGASGKTKSLNERAEAEHESGR